MFGFLTNSLKEEIVRLKSEIENLKKELADAGIKLQKQTEEAKLKLEEQAQHAASKLKQMVDSSALELQTRKQESDLKLENQAQEAKDRLQKLAKKAKSKLQSQEDAARKECEVLNSRLEQAANYADRIQELTKENLDLKEQVDTLGRGLQSATDKHKLAQTAAAEQAILAQKTIQDLQTQLQQIQQNLTALQKEMEVCIETSSAESEKAQKADQKSSSLAKELASVQKDQESTAAELRKVQDQLKAKLQDLATMEKDLGSASATMETQKAEIASLNLQVAELEDTVREKTPLPKDHRLDFKKYEEIINYIQTWAKNLEELEAKFNRSQNQPEKETLDLHSELAYDLESDGDCQQLVRLNPGKCIQQVKNELQELIHSVSDQKQQLVEQFMDRVSTKNVRYYKVELLEHQRHCELAKKHYAKPHGFLGSKEEIAPIFSANQKLLENMQNYIDALVSLRKKANFPDLE